MSPSSLPLLVFLSQSEDPLSHHPPLFCASWESCVCLPLLLTASHASRDNAFEHLRKQYLKRAPDQNPLGTLEEPIEWPTLGLGVKVCRAEEAGRSVTADIHKVQIIWELCEWQLLDPARFRALLPSEDDAASWASSPRDLTYPS